MSRTEPIQISLFGTLTLRCGDLPIALPASSDARSLLVFLALHRERPHPRSVLVDRFWEELDENRARRALSQALWHIKRSVPDLLDATPAQIGLKSVPPLVVDAVRFEQLVGPHVEQSAESVLPNSKQATAELYEALELYRGDLLEDVDAHWVLVERERLRELYSRALTRLISLEKAASRYQKALDLALKLVALDSLREESSREVMRLYFLLKRPVEALQHYEECRQVLDRELGIEPERETVALAREIDERSEKRSGPVFLPVSAEVPQTIARRTAQLPLIGRRTERAALLNHVEALFGGQSGLVLLDGEAGVGKTRLLEELIRDAEWRGLQPLLGSCDDVESAPAYEPLIEALSDGLSPLRAEQLARLVPAVSLSVLAPLLPTLASTLPDLPRAPVVAGHERHNRLKHAFSQTIFAWARTTPLILILEDLQWADRDMMSLLLHLVQALENVATGHHGVLLIGTFRLAEARSRAALWENLQQLDRSGLARRFSLRPLDDARTAELMRAGLGYSIPAPLFESRLFKETDGNPLFVLETLRALQERGLLTCDESGAWSTPYDDTTTDYAELLIPPAVERVIQSRLEQLSPELRQAIASATVLGRDFDFDLLSAVSDLSPQEILQAVQQLKQRRFIDESPDAYRFSHAKIRQVAYSDLEDQHRLELHRRAATSLESQERSRLESMAHHCLQGGLWDKAVNYSIKAAEQAESVHANQAALNHYERALDVLEQHVPFSAERCRFLEFDLLEQRARMYWLTGQIEKQERDIKRLQRCAAELKIPERIARAFNEMAHFLCSVLDQYDTAEKTASVALNFAREHHLMHQTCRALETIGLTHQFRDQLPEAEATLEEALAAWNTIEPMSGQVARVKTELARVYWKQRRLEQAELTCNETLELALELEDYPTVTQLHKMLAVFATKRADYENALKHDETALKYARTAGIRQHEATILANQSLTWRDMGQLGKAIRQMGQALQLELQLASRRGIVMASYNLSVLLLECGRIDEAEAVMQTAYPHLRAIDMLSPNLLYPSNEVLLSLERGAPEAGLAAGNEALLRAEKAELTYHTALLNLNLGRSLRRAGRTDEALAHFERALEIWGSIGEVTYGVITRGFLADCRRELGDLSTARELIDQAVLEMQALICGDLPQAVYYFQARILDQLGESNAASEALDRSEMSIAQQAETLDSEQAREQFLNQVAMNREVREYIRQFRERTQGKTLSVNLPRIGAPLGRPLRDDERVDVKWTVETGDDLTIRSKAKRRRSQIRRLLVEAQDQGAAPTYNHLAEALGVSCRTIDRDMIQLRQSDPDLPGTRRQL